jgi:PAS domain S-box-containing protein/putative nucleotidyltransferase with HDIG domain
MSRKKGLWKLKKEKRKTLHLLLGAFFLLALLMIASKLFNFSGIIFGRSLYTSNKEWADLITYLLLVLLTVIITILTIFSKQQSTVKVADIIPRVENGFSHYFLEEAPVFFVALEADQRIRYMNKTMLDSLGYKEKDVLQKDYFKKFIPPDQHDILLDRFFNLDNGSSPPQTHNENAVLTKDGKELWIKWYIQPVYNGYGELRYYNSIGIDLTTQRNADLVLGKLFIPQKEQSNIIALKGKIVYELFSESHFSSKLEKSLEYLSKILPNDGSDIAFLENSHLKTIAVLGYKKTHIQKIVKNLSTDINNYPLEKEVMEKHKAIIITDALEDPRWNVIPGLEWIRSCIKIPFTFGGEQLGTLGIVSEKPNAFNQKSLKKIEGFVHGITFAIYNYLNYQQLLKSRDDIIHTITKLVESRDPYTAGHQEKVARLATAIALEMRLEEDRVEAIRVASLVHDIGKANIPSEILNKPSRLNDMEYNLVKNHSQLGYDILKDISFSLPIADIVYQHHEKFDGSGYPNGLKGKEIMLEARIISVADVFEAMASHRPYRPALGIEAAEEELKKNKGILYDPQAVDACLILDEKDKILSAN